MGTLVLNSRGLNTKDGAKIIARALDSLAKKNADLVERSKLRLFAVSVPGYQVDEIIRKNCIEILGLTPQNIYMSADGIPDGITPELLYVTEGNTFRILKYMQDCDLLDYIRKVMQGNPKTVYIGSSAGAMIAGVDIALAKDFDRNDEGWMNLTALGLFDGTIIPHLTKSQVRRYLSFKEEHVRNRYTKIYAVGNDEVVTMPV